MIRVILEKNKPITQLHCCEIYKICKANNVELRVQ